MSQDHSHQSPADDAAKQRKKRYKKSLNLPSTPFPMRANLTQNEAQSRKRWEAADLYRAIVDRDGDDPIYCFHDGPPYANGQIHVGHLLNKVLKDLVVRTRNLTGRRCPYVPGWDCHGLPIEHKVVAGLVESGKMAKLDALDVDTRRMAIRKACARYAEKFIGLQAEQMKRLLTLADYDHPYKTMVPAYEREVLGVFVKLLRQGLVYRALKPVHWSIANRTALAEAELEYQDRTDPSVYVRFPAADPAAVAAAFGLGPDDLGGVPSFLIWTTTPWTLPANMLIAVHPEYRYSLVRVGERLDVVATELLARVTAEAGVEAETVAEARGEDLLDIRYTHPFRDWKALDHEARVVGADYVTLEDGTGLVHTATGHGEEDYATGRREGVPVYCPVRDDGTYDETVPEWLHGIDVWTANGMIVERLRASGHLLHHAPYPHSYPHDWRSKTPVIFRCTEQWFVAVDQPTPRDGASLRDLALRAVADDVEFIPTWGENRMRGMLESRPDWCLSRQRAWGLPIPAFRRPDGTVLMTAASTEAVAEVFGRDGSDAWFEKSPAELLAGWRASDDPDVDGDVDPASLQKMYDIFDVWFESGSSWNAVLRARDLGYPADLYLEGSDQHRGWFQLSMLPALGATGQPPFRRLLTHGFMVDKDGRKMSKSVGNTLEVEDLLQRFGADVCRWWVSSLAFENDIKVDLSFFEVAGESYRKVRNTLRFLLSNLADFAPEHAVDLDALAPTSVDAWVLAEASKLRQRVVDAYEQFEFRHAHLLLFDFCNDTLSAGYLSAVKDRLYCDLPDSPRRRVTQTVLYTLCDLATHLLAPIVPHTADEAWRSLHGHTGDSKDGQSVHRGQVPLLQVEAEAGWKHVLEVRDAALKAIEQAKSVGIENPLDAGLVLPDPEGRLAPFLADLADLFGVSRVECDAAATAIEVQDLRGEPRCERSWRRDETVALRSDGGWLSDRDAEAVGAAQL